MLKLLKWGGIALAAVAAVILLALATVYAVSETHFQKSYVVEAAVPVIPTGVEAEARGRHLIVTRGCVDCHGDDLGGKVFIDDPAFGRFSASNLTAGRGGVGALRSDADWVRAIRHGVGADGKPLLFMPSYEFWPIGDQDLGAMIAYLKTLPPVDSELPASSVRPLGRLLYLAGEVPLVSAALIDHAAARPVVPPVAVSVEYGRYLATGCVGCHGKGYSGGKVPGTPPNWPAAANLTSDASGLAGWSRADFVLAMRAGKRPDGRVLAPQFMPWQSLGKMNDAELEALWLFLSGLPARPFGQ